MGASGTQWMLMLDMIVTNMSRDEDKRTGIEYFELKSKHERVKPKPLDSWLKLIAFTT